MTLRRPYAILFLLFVLLGVYYPTLFAPFNSVDDLKMTNWLLNSDFPGLKSTFLPGSSGYYYRPLLRISFWIDKYLWGLEESFMHLENILWHSCNSLLVFFLAARIGKEYNFFGYTFPLVAALLFGLHPVNTEAVNWISGRTDLLAGFFLLASLLLLLNAIDRQRFMFCLAAASSFLLACLAKETALFFLPGALVLVFCRNRIPSTNPLLELRSKAALYLAMTAAAVSYLLFRTVAFSKGDTGVRHAAKSLVGSDANNLYTLKVIFKVAGFYLKKLFVPWPLNFGIIHISNWYIILGIILAALIVYYLIRRDTLAALYLTSITVGASSLIVAVSRMAWTPVAERYIYISSATFVIAMTITTMRNAERFRLERVLKAAVPMLLLGMAISTTMRNITWQDNELLFSDTSRKSPDFLPAKNDLAIAKIAKGKKDQGYTIINSLNASLELKNRELADINKAKVQVAEGKLIEAEKLMLTDLGKSLQTDRQILELLVRIAELKLEKGDGFGSVQAIRGSMVRNLSRLQELTGDPFYYYRQGQVLLAMGMTKEAQPMFEKASRFAPAGSHYKEAAGKLSVKLLQK